MIFSSQTEIWSSPFKKQRWHYSYSAFKEITLCLCPICFHIINYSYMAKANMALLVTEGKIRMRHSQAAYNKLLQNASCIQILFCNLLITELSTGEI